MQLVGRDEMLRPIDSDGRPNADGEFFKINVKSQLIASDDDDDGRYLISPYIYLRCRNPQSAFRSSGKSTRAGPLVGRIALFGSPRIRIDFRQEGRRGQR